MKVFKRLNTLYLNTSFTLAFGLICFTLVSAVVVFNFILSPLAYRAADDLGGLMHILSKSWVALPEQEKVEFQAHLRKQHFLFITDEKVDVGQVINSLPFIPRLESALHHHTGQALIVMEAVDDGCYWVAIPQGKQVVNIGFLHNRIGPQPLKVVAGVIVAGCFLIMIATILMVQRITKPITTLSKAVKLLSLGKLSTRLPEVGPEELVLLARSFNQMAEEITQLLANRSLLFGGISHDLRTPITRIRIALELIDNEEIEVYVSGMRSDLDEMELLITQTLELIKGMDRYRAVNVDISQLMDDIVANYDRQGLVVKRKVSACGVCNIEVNAFRRVLCNLLDNAFRYGGDKPVTLLCRQVEGRLLLSVLDRGPGIPKDKMDLVFHPFFRLDVSRSKVTGGSGLGLAIVRQLCEIHEWKIQLLPRDDVGLEVRLEIPFSK